MHKRIPCLILGCGLLLSLSACTAPVSNPNPSTLPSASQAEPSSTAATEAKFEEVVLVDNENALFKITAIEDDSIWGYTLKAHLENKTDKELMFSLNNTSVNGFMCDPLWASTVSAGMKANEEISFSDADFQRNGIETVADITFTLRIYDSSDWSADDLVKEEFTVYPLGEAAASPYTRTAHEGEIVLFEDENCAMIVTGFDPDSIWGYAVNVYLENKTDKNLMFSVSDAAVNGYMCDPFWAETVAAGKRSNTSISWLASELKSNGITEVESLTLPITVYNADDWTGDYLIDATFTLNP